MIPVTSATFFNVDSIDFLLPYSLLLLTPPIPSPSPPFGLISITEITKIIPARNISAINTVFISIRIIYKKDFHYIYSTPAFNLKMSAVFHTIYGVLPWWCPRLCRGRKVSTTDTRQQLTADGTSGIRSKGKCHRNENYLASCWGKMQRGGSRQLSGYSFLVWQLCHSSGKPCLLQASPDSCRGRAQR